ncbi:MAG: SemiSWEET transporter [Algibacter sp.]|uniref:SemiSWEET family sugar transporter n=1 Tax=Algibacter sp. TaxID=1872428 RepID=UPI002622446A|nr:SemiSWEET transporter [Algibacter sp.]MDG1731189.1 SemiSWEET transporter [Algibacter sp.]MDG2178028.1 SemiSWEET transporter [Algibacter sp.]
MFEIDAIEIIGFIAAFLTTSAFVPQVYKTWKTKNVEAISLTMYLVMFTGVFLWLLYGIYMNSLSMLIANIITSSLILVLILLKIKYSKKE